MNNELLANCKFNYQIQLNIELLEDLHSGTGSGSTTTDSLQFRDENNQVCIPASHLRGVWRDNAARLIHLGIIDPIATRILFSQLPGDPQNNIIPERGKLLPRSLRLINTDNGETVFWSSSARQENSRCPQEHSLRTIEYIAAGNHFEACIELEQVTEASKDAFLAILRFTDRLGSYRSRGCGQIKTTYDCQQQARPVEHVKNQASTTTTLRLLLKNEEPLSLPTTGFPGNIIGSASYIHGRTLLGGLTAWAIQQGNNSLRTMLHARQINIANAYPLPQGLTLAHITDLTTLECLPTPLNIYRIKPGTYPPQSNAENWPHWAEKQSTYTTALSTQGRYRDQFNVIKGSPKGKRPAAHSYIFKQAEYPWSIYNSDLTVQMRNRRGSPLALKAKSSETELFTVEQIPANTLFVVDLKASDIETMHAFKHALGALLNKRQVLRIGRGGAPVKIENYTPMEPTPPKNTGSHNKLRITLTSDLIARSPKTLGYYRQLNHQILYQLLGCSPPAESGSWSESYLGAHSKVHGFNAASGLPRAPIETLRRGSVLEIKGNHLEHIYDKLISCTNQALGECQWEGYGQYRVDFSPLTSQPTKQQAGNECITQLSLKHAKQLQSNLMLSKHQLRKILSNISKHTSAPLPQQTLQALFDRLEASSQNKRGQLGYKTFFDAFKSMDDYAQLHTFNSDQLRHYMDVLVRKLSMYMQAKEKLS